MKSRSVAASLATTFLTAILLGCSPAAPLGPDEIVAAFISQSQNETRTFHMEWQGTMSTTGDPVAMTATLTASFDFSGSDYAGTATTRTGAGGQPDPFSSTTAYARVAGVLFTRYADSGWQRMEPNWGGQSEFDPLRGLAAEGVAYEASETIDGATLHRLRVLDPAAALNASLFSGSAELIPEGDPDYVVYVDAHAVPVRAQVRLNGQLALGGEPAEFSPPPTSLQLTFDYVFSAWGEEFFIRSPM